MMSRSATRSDAVGLWRVLPWVTACLALALPAQAEEPVDLVWEVPANCPRASVVQQRIREMVGKTSSRKTRLRAKGRVVKVGNRYRLTLTVHDGDAVRDRTIESGSCVDLAGAAAVSLGVMLRTAPDAARAAREGGAGGSGGAASEGSPASDNRAAAGAGEGASAASKARGDQEKKPSAGEPLPEAKPKAGKPEDSEKEAAPPELHESTAPKRRWSVLLRAPLATVELGPLPAPSLALGVGVGVRYDEWRFVVTGRIFDGQMVPLPDSTDVGAAIGRTTVELGACRGWRVASALELAPCLGLALDHLTARGVGTDIEASEGSSSSLVVGGGATAHVLLTDWLALTAVATGGLQTSRTRIVVEGLGPVHQVGAGLISFGVGSEWIF